MKLDLASIQRTCELHALDVQAIGRDELRVAVSSDAVLCFANLVSEGDTYIGFVGTPWHFHEVLVLMYGPDSMIELSATEVMSALIAGDLLICTRLIGRMVTDRWLVHRKEPQSLQYMQPGESLLFERLGDHARVANASSPSDHVLD